MSSVIGRLVKHVMSLPPAIHRTVRVERGVRVLMDDGVELIADLYMPSGSGSYPTILVRSPYGRGPPFGLMFGQIFAERGYRVMVQSCRGTFGSGGVFHPNFNERADGLATIRWIESQPWFDGRLAMNGLSYLGSVEWAVADAAGPALRALCTHVTYSNILSHWYRGGSFALGDMIDWTTMVTEQETERFRGAKMIFRSRLRRIDRVIDSLPIVELDERVMGRRVAFWRELVEHAASSDSFWAPVDHSARMSKVSVPVLQVGGWYDIFLPNQLADYASLVASGNQPRLVIGPWTHVSSRGFAAQVRESLCWMDRHVRGTQPPAKSDESMPVRLFIMGADAWSEFASWPPPGYQPQRWYLHSGGRLGIEVPSEGEPSSYEYDPADPTPIVGGTLLRRTGGRRNQARTERRPDVLVFTSDVLRTDLEIIGELTADLHVSSNLQYFDVFVRLCDVDAKGRSTNVCDGLERFSLEGLYQPKDGIWTLRVLLWPTAQLFRAGHRIRVQVSSGAHPRFARNLGTNEPIATATEMRVAHQRIHHHPLRPSAITLPVRAARDFG